MLPNHPVPASHVGGGRSPAVSAGWLAHQFVQLGRDVLGMCGAPLIGVTVIAPGTVACIPWDDRSRLDFETARELARGPRAGPFVAQLARLAPMLMDRLLGPAAAAGPIGFVTDGIGLGFSPDLPAPLAADWLERLAVGEGRFAEILPFAERSAWRGLVAPIPYRHSWEYTG